MILSLICLQAFCAPIKIVTNDDNPPFSFTLPDKTITGLYVEFWQLWSKYNDQPIDIYLKNFEASIEEVKFNNAVHSGVLMTQDRIQWADFSPPIYRVETGILFNRNFSASSQLEDFKHLKVAVQVGSFQAAYIRQHYPHFELITYSDPTVVFNQLLLDEIDAIISELPFIKVQLAKRELNGVLVLSDEILMSNTIHAMVAKDQPALFKLINDGIHDIPVEEIIKLEEKWLPSLDSFHKNRYALPYLTIEENQWLIDNPVISVAFDSSWYPVEFIDANNNFNGIAADYIKHLSQTLDIEFVPIHHQHWSESFAEFKAGKIDVLSAIMMTEKRLELITFSQPYLQIPTAIITRKNGYYFENLEELKGKKLGLTRGFASIEMVKKDHPEINTVIVNSIVDGLKQLNDGKIDAYIGSLAVVNYEIDKNRFNNLRITAFSPYNLNLSMSVRHGLEPLAGIINKTIDQMSEKQKIAIKNDWLAIYMDNGTDINRVLEWIIPIIVLLLFIIVVISRFNKKLQTQIDQRKAAEKELKHLATHDGLTNLPNWRNFEQQFNQHIKTDDDDQHALLFIDLDGFKTVNDTHGHQAGDNLLIAVANRLKQTIKQSGIVARIGGDEFIVFMPKVTNNNTIKTMCENIITAINQPHVWHNQSITVGTSIGVAIYPDNAKSLDELTSLSDTAMYHAKNSGKNGYKFI